MEDLKNQNFNFIDIEANFYIYVIPTKSASSKDKVRFQNFMHKRKEYISNESIDSLFKQQTYKYIKLFSSANPIIAQDINNLKNPDPKIWYGREKYSIDENQYDSKYNQYSIVHGIILEPKATRYYPYWEFMSNILWS